MSGLVSLNEAVVERPWATTTGNDPTRWLRRLVSERRIPFYKAGGRVLVDLDDLDAFAQAGRVDSAPSLRSVPQARRRPKAA